MLGFSTSGPSTSGHSHDRFQLWVDEAFKKINRDPGRTSQKRRVLSAGFAEGNLVGLCAPQIGGHPTAVPLAAGQTTAFGENSCSSTTLDRHRGFRSLSANRTSQDFPPFSVARLFQIVAGAQPVGPSTDPGNTTLVGHSHIWDSPSRR